MFIFFKPIRINFLNLTVYTEMKSNQHTPVVEYRCSGGSKTVEKLLINSGFVSTVQGYKLSVSAQLVQSRPSAASWLGLHLYSRILPHSRPTATR